jgi:hypothetical protein
VALVTGLREICRHVIGIRGSLEILQVAAHASARIQVVIVVNVAVCAGAWRNCVQAGQDKAGSGVIKRSVGPQYGVVALLTSRREARMGYW